MDYPFYFLVWNIFVFAMDDLAIFIINHISDDLKLVVQCIKSIKAFDITPVRITHSKSSSQAKNAILDYTKMLNKDYVFIINSDCELLTDPRPIFDVLKEDVGVVGCKVWTSGIPVTGINDIGQQITTDTDMILHNAFAVSGNFWLIRNNGIRFDKNFKGSSNHDDVDFCIRMRKQGFRVVQHNGVSVKHNRPFTKAKPYEWNNLYFRAKHPTLFLKKLLVSSILRNTKEVLLQNVVTT